MERPMQNRRLVSRNWLDTLSQMVSDGLERDRCAYRDLSQSFNWMLSHAVKTSACIENATSPEDVSGPTS